MEIVFAVTLIGIAGIGAQWVAWRFNLPAIVLMAVAGILLGPVFGVLRPEATFGEIYQPLISIAVGIILFEGGLQLRFEELREVGRSVRRLIFPGAIIAWALGFLAAWKVAGLGVPTALLFSGIMVVTGPTVIMPLLRQAKLSSRPATLLRWEGIVNDPVGALLAVIVFEVLHLSAAPYSLPPFQIGGSLALGAIISTVWGVLLGRCVAISFRNGWVPEFLKTPILLTSALACFAAANALQEEGGLLAVTAMGITIANSKLPSINQLMQFKENIAVMFVSGVFVMLTANLTFDVLFSLDASMWIYVVVMLVLVRPAAVFLSLIGTNTTYKERTLIGWIAPRGIVAVAVSGLFAAKMVELGFEDGAKMVPLAFAMVFATVIAHGFTIGPVGKLLGLAQKGRPGVLIVGGSPWTAALGEKLEKELKAPVLIADSSYRALRPARNAGLKTFYGEILSEVTEHHIEFVRYHTLIAASANESHNALVCTDLAPEMDRARTFQLSSRGEEELRKNVSHTLRGRRLFDRPLGIDELMQRWYNGWGFQLTRVSEAYPPEKLKEALGEESVIVCVERDDAIIFSAFDRPVEPRLGDRVLAFVPDDVSMKSGQKEVVDEEIEIKKAEALENAAPTPDLTTG